MDGERAVFTVRSIPVLTGQGFFLDFLSPSSKYPRYNDRDPSNEHRRFSWTGGPNHTEAIHRHSNQGHQTFRYTRTKSHVALTDKIRLKDHRRITSQLETRIPRRVFAGATLDMLFTGADVEKLDDSTREQVLAFATDFIDCGCDGSPHCGHPERAFLRYVLELRAEGFGPEDIVDAMRAEYGVTTYPGDVLTFLDDTVRHLDAMEALAAVEENVSMEEVTRDKRQALEDR